MEWLQVTATVIVALVAIARLGLDWRKERRSKRRDE